MKIEMNHGESTVVIRALNLKLAILGQEGKTTGLTLEQIMEEERIKRVLQRIEEAMLSE